MEFLKTYDRQHNYIETVSRQLAHDTNYQYYHEVVHIIVKSETNKILVQKRSPQKSQHPNMFDLSVTGHVGFEDDLLTACQREMSEEIGICLNSNNFKFIKTIIDDKNKEFINIFLCEQIFDENFDFNLQQEEVDSVEFLSKDEYIDLLMSKNYVPYFCEYKNLVAEIVEKI